MTGQSPPSCFIRVIRFLPTSPARYDTPRRSHSWPAGVRGDVARPLSPPRRLSLLGLADTGAACTLITPGVALELDLDVQTPVRQARIASVHRVVSAPVVRLASVQIGGPAPHQCRSRRAAAVQDVRMPVVGFIPLPLLP